MRSCSPAGHQPCSALTPQPQPPLPEPPLAQRSPCPAPGQLSSLPRWPVPGSAQCGRAGLAAVVRESPSSVLPRWGLALPRVLSVPQTQGAAACPWWGCSPLSALGPNKMDGTAPPSLFGVGKRLRGLQAHPAGSEGRPATHPLSGEAHLVIQGPFPPQRRRPQSLPKATVRFLQFLILSKQWAAETTQVASSRTPPHSRAPFSLSTA